MEVAAWLQMRLDEKKWLSRDITPKSDTKRQRSRLYFGGHDFI